MPYELAATRYFLKKYNKLIKNHAALEQRIDSVIKRMLLNPQDPNLKSHKVIANADGKAAMSSTITDDLRIIWRYGEKTNEVQILDAIDIGGHSGSKKVYQ